MNITDEPIDAYLDALAEAARDRENDVTGYYDPPAQTGLEVMSLGNATKRAARYGYAGTWRRGGH